jgi:peptidoglycan/LPS O-acetylase OafA/YrhL
VATVGAVITDLLYTAISLALVHMVGQTLSRNSRAFLPQKPGQDGMAEAVTRVLVVAYYLLALGFIALTMPTWSHVPSPGRAMELLSVQIGILLLVLGGLHLAGTAVLARLRRSRPWLTRAAPAGEAATLSDPGADREDGADADQRPRSAPFWRPHSRDTVN